MACHNEQANCVVQAASLLPSPPPSLLQLQPSRVATVCSPLRPRASTAMISRTRTALVHYYEPPQRYRYRGGIHLWWILFFGLIANCDRIMRLGDDQPQLVNLQ